MKPSNNSLVLAGVSLEVASYYPDNADRQAMMSRAEYSWMIIQKALQIINDLKITIDTEDIDEVVSNYLAQEESLS